MTKEFLSITIVFFFHGLFTKEIHLYSFMQTRTFFDVPQIQLPLEPDVAAHFLWLNLCLLIKTDFYSKPVVLALKFSIKTKVMLSRS